MPIPTMDEAYATLEEKFRASTGSTTVAIQYFPAVLQAAVAAESARTIQQAVTALSDGVNGLRNAQADFTRASDEGTQSLATWSKSMTLATWGLFVFAGVQAIATVVQVWLATIRLPVAP